MTRGQIASTKGRICLYPGSFNPLHVGHMMLAHYAHEHLGFDEVWLVLSPLNPLKDSRDTLPYTLRRQLIECAIAPYPYLRLETLEAHLPLPHYTVRSLRALRLLHPKVTFAMLMGADSLASIGRWHQSARLLQELELYVYPRPGSIMEKRTDINLSPDPIPNSITDKRTDAHRHPDHLPDSTAEEHADAHLSHDPRPTLSEGQAIVNPLLTERGTIHLCHDAPTSTLSSTEIRTALANGTDASALLPCPHLWSSLREAIQAGKA